MRYLNNTRTGNKYDVNQASIEKHFQLNQSDNGQNNRSECFSNIDFLFVCFNCTQLRSCITYYSLRLPIGNHIVCIAHYKLCVRNILLFFFNSQIEMIDSCSFSFCLLMEYSTPNMYAKKTMLHAQLCINWFKARIPNNIVSLDFVFWKFINGSF